MPLLHDVDILPVDYPLFDWSDWPESRAALVQGGPTSAFQMACWNAMVTHLAEALESAGLEWDPGTGIEGTGDRFIYPVEKVLMTDGILHGYRFNRMVANINGRLPEFHWLWATDESYRGYIGRVLVSEFPIVSTPNNLPDVVYPEYLTELVSRMNQFIEIMRGTWPVHRISNEIKAETVFENRLSVDFSAPLRPEINASSIMQAKQMEVLPGISTGTRVKSGTVCETGVINIRTKQIAPHWLQSKVNTRFDGEVIRADWMKIKPLTASSLAKSLLECLVMMETRAEHHAKTTAGITPVLSPPVFTAATLKLISWYITGAVKQPSLPTVAQAVARSRKEASAVLIHSLSTGAEEYTGSYQKAEISSSRVQRLEIYRRSETEAAARVTRNRSVITSATEKSTSETLTNLQGEKALPTAANQSSCISRKLTVIKNRARPGWAEQSSETGMVCSLGTAWDGPIWKDGGLWIRQARTIKILADGSMDLSGSGDPIGAKQESSTIVVAALGNAWMAPVWLDDGLYIRQVRQADVLEDGSLDLTGAGDEMAVRQRSETRVSASLDTGWYPPEQVNDGLYLRQVYEEPVQNENGELEVR